MTLDKSHSKNLAILSVGTLKRLIGEVEEINREAENRIVRSSFSKDEFPFLLIMFVMNLIQYIRKETEDRALSFVEVHTRRGELAN